MTASLPADTLLLVVGALLVGGALLAGYSDRLRLPAPVLFLVLGMVLGDDGLGLVRVSYDDTGLVQAVGSVALVVILFYGGLTTKPTDLRRAAVPGILLATTGVLVTAGIVAVATRLIFEVEWSTGVLLGAAVSSTDAAAVFAVLRRTALPRRLQSLLEVESGANDPLAVMLTVGALAAFAQPVGIDDWVVFGARQLLGGAAVGGAVGGLAVAVLNRANLASRGLYPVLALAAAALSYGTAAALGTSGFLAVYISGLLVGARVPRHRSSIQAFHDGLANTAEIGLFLLLGLLVFPSQLVDVALRGLIVAGVLTFLARPVAIHLHLWPLGYSWAERHLMTWAGLRGAVPIVLATFPLIAGHPEGVLLFNIVFFVVFVSVAVQGTTIGLFAHRLGLDEGAQVWAPVAEATPLEGVDADLVEVDVTADLPIAGQRLRDVPLPPGGVLTAVVRGTQTSLATGNTLLQPGDLLLIALPRQRDPTGKVVAWARGELPTSNVPDPPAGDSPKPGSVDDTN